MSRIPSSLARHAGSMRDPDPEAAWRAAEAVWHEHGFALLNPEAVEAKHGWAAGQEVRNIAERCFGKRKAEL